jgi:hypothetical protein
MASIKKFCDLAKGQVDKGIYVWGAQGQLLTDISPEWIRNRETSASNANKAIEMYNKRKNIPGARAYDCSGLMCWSLTECGAKDKGFDKTAEGLRQMCSKLSKPTEDGDLCFKIKDGKAHHVGMYVGGKIVEAKGRAYGVVSSSVSSSWNAFGRLNIKWDDEPKGYVLTRVLKYGMGSKDNPDPDVKALQKRLKELGYPFPDNKGGIDGIFRNWTDKIVRQFQVDKKLKVDGKVGEQTAKKLGWIWKG